MLLSIWLEDYTIQLANSLSSNGVTVLLALVSSSQITEYSDIDKRVETYSFMFPSNPISKFRLVNEILNLIDSFKPDVLHLQGVWPYYAIILLYAKLKKFRIVITLHDVTPHLGESSLLQSVAMYFEVKIADRFIVHGSKLKYSLEKNYGVNNNKICVTTLGEHEVIPFERFWDPQINEEGNLVLFFGRIKEYKGLQYLIMAEPHISNAVPKAKIIIAGAGDDFSKYEKLMLNRSNFIVYNYRIPYNEGAKLFQKCSVVVLPYVDGSQSGVIPTAYSFKKPVIATNVGSIPEIVDDALTGFIIPAGDPLALANSVIRLLLDESLRINMGKNAYKKLKVEMSWETITKKTISIYEELL